MNTLLRTLALTSLTFVACGPMTTDTPEDRKSVV
jgi:hypothetical protein